MAKNKKPYGTVLIKSVQILDLLSQRAEPQSMSEISEYTEITMSTTNKILDTLELVGFVSRNDLTRKYSLGPRLIQLANASFIQFDIARETYPTLKRLFDTVGTTVNLGMYQEDKVMFVNKFSERESSVETISRIGFTQPLYCSAMGKAILAEMTPEEFDHYIEETELVANTEHTITEKEVLKKDIELIRERGYAIDDREAEENIFCVGITFRVEGEPDYYAFSISSPYHKLTEERYEYLVSELIKTKTIIEYQLSMIKSSD